MISHDIHSDTIIAQCTPHGPGALALLRLSGAQAFTIANGFTQLSHQKVLSDQKTHTIHYGFVIDNHGIHIDQVLFLLMRAPHTFTGDDTVEITCHNNPFIIESIIQRAICVGARMATNGEFSKRAVLNGKIDVLQAEAINDLIHANTQIALKQSLSHLQGTFSHAISNLEKQLITALAYSESSFEFLDEENMEFSHTIYTHINSVLNEITQLKKTFEIQKQVRQGIRIAIIGSVNAGKSSLFNALLDQDRAIVTAIPGTTRDVIEAGMYRNGAYWTLIDTAGLRTTDDIIEQMGIERSYEEAEKADIILLVYDSTQRMDEKEHVVYDHMDKHYQQKTIIVANKTDLPGTDNVIVRDREIICVSSTKKINIASVIAAIDYKVYEVFSQIGSPFLLNKRHYNLLISLEQKLIDTIPLLTTTSVAYELVSYHLNDALVTISELTGKSISEAAMDAVFREFCVGK